MTAGPERRPESLHEHLRHATRNFTAPLAEDEVFALGAELARELSRAHAETPARHPSLEPQAIAMADGHPRLEGTGPEGDVPEDLFQLGALLCWLASGAGPQVSWRLDGPPLPALSSLARRSALAGLATPRRSERFPSATEAAVALESALVGPADAPAPWPAFRGGAPRAGAREAEPTASSLEPAWQARLGPVVASPVVAPGVVIAATADGRICFLDERSGRGVYEARVASAIESSPALAGTLIVVGTDDGELLALDAVEGRERFRVRLGQMVRSSPLTVDDRVVVGVVDGKAGSLTALAAAQGRVLWTRKLAAVFSSPALAGDSVLVGSDDGSLHAFDLARGTPLWSHALGAKVRGTPAVAGETAVVGDFAGRVVALSVKDGSRRWARDIGHPMYSSPCLAAGLCVVGCREGHVHGLELATGVPRFELATRGPVVSSPAAAGDRFLVGSTDGSLYLIGPDGRVLHACALARAGIDSSPAVGPALPAVFVGSGEGLHAVRLKP